MWTEKTPQPPSALHVLLIVPPVRLPTKQEALPVMDYGCSAAPEAQLCGPVRTAENTAVICSAVGAEDAARIWPSKVREELLRKKKKNAKKKFIYFLVENRALRGAQ